MDIWRKSTEVRPKASPKTLRQDTLGTFEESQGDQALVQSDQGE